MEKAAILLIDDDPASVHALMEYLHISGFKTTIAPSGERALRQIERSQPDIILLDALMPGGIDGFETCRRLKANKDYRDIPVIFMTALAATIDKVKGFEAGGDDYITKPLQHEEVLARIHVHLSLRQAQQQLKIKNALLEEQNTRFQILSDATFEGIVIHDQGRILEVNQTLPKMLGYQRDELLGQDVLEFITAEYRDLARRHIQNQYEQSYEIEAIRQDSSSFPAEIQAKIMPYQGRDVRVAAVRDLSWRRAMEEAKEHLEKENLNLRTTFKERYKFGDIIGKSPAMQELYELIAHTAATDVNVLLLGESGTGKELIARTIHQRSDRSDKPFIPVNCGAIPDSLFESEFFGHRKGAFTGADRHQEGFFDAAHTGILFLDEVGELPPAMQVKLLRVLESGEYNPIGDHTIKRVDVRIIAATNRDITEQLQKQDLRQDFFFRLSVITMTLPPLRDRKEDIPLLLDHFLKHYNAPGNSRAKIPAKMVETLYNYDWPGNIREFQNVLQRYLTLGRLNFSNNLKIEPNELINSDDVRSALLLSEALETLEKRMIADTLRQNFGHRGKTAAKLGIPLRSLHRKIKKYGFV